MELEGWFFAFYAWGWGYDNLEGIKKGEELLEGKPKNKMREEGPTSFVDSGFEYLCEMHVVRLSNEVA